MSNFGRLPDVSKGIANLRKHKGKLVFTNGCFDILHVGHLRYLEQAKSLGDVLVVGLNSDLSVQKLKGRTRPIVPEEERAELLANLKPVDFVCIFNEETPLSLITKLRPDLLVKGGDWKIEQIVGGEFVKSYGGEVRSLKFIDGKSTTDIVSRIKST